MKIDYLQSLTATHPDLASEAHGWDPTSISAGVGKKFNWICKMDHIYSASPNNRKNGSGCPYCANRKTLKGYNDLASTHPELALEAFGWDPHEVRAGSHAKVAWTCNKGHIWDARVDSRSGAGTGCPTCSGRVPDEGVNDLATEFPEIASRACGWDPSKYKSHSGLKKKWKCEYGHIWQSVIAEQVNGGGCAVCSGHQVLKGFNDLATVNPEVATQASGWDPSTVTAGSGVNRKWICAKGHKWTAPVVSRKLANLGCPTCYGKKVLAGYNDLASLFPAIAVEADGWDPAEVTAYSAQRKNWKCSKGDRWTVAVSSRTVQNSGCPYCSGRVAREGETDLLTTHPSLAKEAVGWDPSQFKAGSGKIKLWRCPKGHEWPATISSRALQGTGCVYCSNNKALAGYNDLATTHPAIASEAFGWDPSTLTAGSGLKRKWKCPLDHVWTGVVGTRVNNGYNCNYCSGRQVLAGFNDLLKLRPDLASQAEGWDPEEYSVGSNKRVNWKCSEGHVWPASISNRTSHDSGCPYCSEYGFNPGKKAHLYLLEHEAWNLYQIGISNDIARRLNYHKSRGWEEIDLLGPRDGLYIFEWEKSILRTLTSRGVELGPRSAGENFSGYTESWRRPNFPAKNLKFLMSFVEEVEANMPTTGPNLRL